MVKVLLKTVLSYLTERILKDPKHPMTQAQEAKNHNTAHEAPIMLFQEQIPNYIKQAAYKQHYE